MKLDMEFGQGTRNIITVDGVSLSIELLKALVDPDPSKLYRMVRRGDCVTVDCVGDQEFYGRGNRSNEAMEPLEHAPHYVPSRIHK